MSLKRLVWTLQKSILEQDREDLIKRTDLEEETIDEVRKILNAEFNN